MDFELQILLGDPKFFGKAPCRLGELHSPISDEQSSFEERRGHDKLLRLRDAVRGNSPTDQNTVRELEFLGISILVIQLVPSDTSGFSDKGFVLN